jgi:cytochrome c556
MSACWKKARPLALIRSREQSSNLDRWMRCCPDGSDFDSKANDLVKAAADLEAAAKSGDEAATKKAAGAVGKTCGACHDQFRNK